MNHKRIGFWFWVAFGILSVLLLVPLFVYLQTQFQTENETDIQYEPFMPENEYREAVSNRMSWHAQQSEEMLLIDVFTELDDLANQSYIYVPATNELSVLTPEPKLTNIAFINTHTVAGMFDITNALTPGIKDLINEDFEFFLPEKKYTSHRMLDVHSNQNETLVAATVSNARNGSNVDMRNIDYWDVFIASPETARSFSLESAANGTWLPDRASLAFTKGDGVYLYDYNDDISFKLIPYEGVTIDHTIAVTQKNQDMYQLAMLNPETSIVELYDLSKELDSVTMSAKIVLEESVQVLDVEYSIDGSKVTILVSDPGNSTFTLVEYDAASYERTGTVPVSLPNDTGYALLSSWYTFNPLQYPSSL